jgi:hypothetical protein
MAYDRRCYNLAELFLSDYPHLDCEQQRHALAQWIQNAIESYIEVEDENYKCQTASAS